MKQVFRYRLVERTTQESKELAMLDQLFPTARAMVRFSQLHSSSRGEDPFLEGFRAMMEEERNFRERTSSVGLNGQLYTELERVVKKHADGVKTMGEKGETVDGRRIYEMIETMKRSPIISKLL